MYSFSDKNLRFSAGLQSNLHEDTFLMENYAKDIPESLKNICCEPHKQMALFYSNQQQKYKCFKCLLEEQDMIYIDKKFKKEMEEFERIKGLTADLIKSQSGKVDMMKHWKGEIRKILINVREQFIKWVDNFTQQFIKSLKDIDKSRELADFQNIDGKLNRQLNELRESYLAIIKVFTTISNSPVDQKVQTIDSHRKTMTELEKQIQTQNYNLNSQISKLIQAQTKTVSLEGLQVKVQQKFMKYFEKKITQQMKGGAAGAQDSIIGMSMLNNTQHHKASVQIHSSPQLKHEKSSVASSSGSKSSQNVNSQQQQPKPQVEQSNMRIQQKSTPQQQQQQQPQKQTLQQIVSQQQRHQEQFLDTIDLSEIGGGKNISTSQSIFPELEFPHSPYGRDTFNNAKMQTKISEKEESKHPLRRDSDAVSSNIDQSTISYKYRHKNQNSIYYLKPRSTEIYLLDFKLQGFVKESITSKMLIPTAFSSIQVSSGCIYILGGLVNEVVSRNCLQIDCNMNMTEKEPMKIGRYNISLALIIDKFIFAIGGNISRGKATDLVEVYDSNINVWYPVGALSKARACTSACQINHRYIYVFPGQQSSTWNTIEQLDIGSSIDPKEMKKLKWTMFTVFNADIQACYAFGSVQLSQNEVLVFGGSKTNTFIFDSSVSQAKDNKKKEVKFVTLKQSELCCESWFNYDSDYVARIFGNYLYAIDSHTQNLHVYSLKDKIWNYSALKDLGIS